MPAASQIPRRGRPRRPLLAEQINADRFRSFVAIGGADECWLWQGTLAPNGYGLFRVGEGKFGAHRVAFAIEHGAAPVGLLVCHSCDNRQCCNPSHLFAGDSAVNILDAVEKGRMVERWRPRAAKG